MSTIYRWVFITFIFLIAQSFVSCGYFENKNESAEEIPVKKKIDKIDLEKYRLVLKTFIGEIKKNPARSRDHLIFLDTLIHFYSQRNYEPVWTRNGVIFGGLHTILMHLENAEEHGLNPEWYHYHELQNSIATVVSGQSNDVDQYYESLGRIELMLSDGLVRYARDLQIGVLNPKQLDAELFFLPIKKASEIDLFTPLYTENIAQYLQSITPREVRYLKLQQALAYYNELNKRGGWDTIPHIKDKIKVGDRTFILSSLAKRLLWTSSPIVLNQPQPLFFPYLIATSSPFLNYISIDWNKVNEGVYDSTLANAMKRYQRDNGLFEDGIIGNKTIDNLNISVTDRITQIKINLDRYRWFQYPDTERYVRVNIPEYYLYAKDSGQTKIKMKICCGEKFRGWRIHGHQPMNYETPLLHGKLSYLVLNPTWNVPASIAVRETYYAALKDPMYLLKNNYNVYHGDSLVNPTSIKWSEVNPNKIPYRFVQQAGRGNALGKIKFMFYNDFDVYLHDTPKRVPFGNAMRAVSHGCVRIEEPISFVKYVFSGHSTWNVGKIMAYLAQSKETKVVMLEEKIPIYIDYVTSWVDPDGRIQFRDDVYGKDKVLAKALLNRK